MIKKGSCRKVFFTLFFIGSVMCTHAQYIAVDDVLFFNEDDPATPINVIGNDINTTGVLEVAVTITGLPSHGDAFVDGFTDEIVYTPDPDYFGLDILTYQACSVEAIPECGTAQVFIYMDTIPDFPIAADDEINTFINVPVTIEPLLNDIDVDNQGIELAIISDASHGATTITGGENIFYEPFADYYGDDIIEYTACKIDDPVHCDTAEITVHVLSTNFNAPVAVADTFEVFLGVSYEEDVLWNDTDGDGDDLILSSIFGASIVGTVSINENNTMEYTGNELGWDVFKYLVCDDNAPSLCDTGLIYMRVVESPVSGEVVHVHNSFSPNGDNIDDFLEIDGIEYFDKYNISIYNRWSSLIYEGGNGDPMWDGKSNAGYFVTNGDVPEGTYYYVLKIVGVPDPMYGFIVLKR